MDTHSKSSRMVSPRQAADMLDVSREVVYRLLQSGGLPAYRIGGQWRIPLDRLEQFLDECANREMRATDETNEAMEGIRA